ncbi:MAG: AmmeMemoRadiSam system protein A [Bilophila sp.]
MAKVSLTLEEQRYLGDVARLAIMRELTEGTANDVPPPPKEATTLQESLGVFVTLTHNGLLRGCIGNMVGQGPLYLTVTRMACAAAFDDSRFPPLTKEEWLKTKLEISVLDPLTRCPDPEQITVGTHGLLLVRGGRSGVFLPQVPVEQHWDRLTYLRQLCGKAGLSSDSWKAPDAELYWFEAFVFSPDQDTPDRA